MSYEREERGIFFYTMRALTWFLILVAITAIVLSICQNSVGSRKDNFDKAHQEWLAEKERNKASTNFWRMLRGEKPISEDSCGLLAKDLRFVFVDNVQNQQFTEAFLRIQKIPISTYDSSSAIYTDYVTVFGDTDRVKAVARLFASPGYYPNLDPKIQETIFKGDGTIDASLIRERLKKGTITESPEPFINDPKFANFSYWHWATSSPWFWVFWTAFSLIAFFGAYLRNYSGDDNIPDELLYRWWRVSDEPFWQSVVILLLFPIFAIRTVMAILSLVVKTLDNNPDSVIVASIKQKKEAAKQREIEEKKRQDNENKPYYKNMSEISELLSNLKAMRNNKNIDQTELEAAILEAQKTLVSYQTMSGQPNSQNLSPELKKEADQLSFKTLTAKLQTHKDFIDVIGP